MLLNRRPKRRLVGASSVRGLALISVLWVLVLLTLIAGTLSANSRSSALMTRNIVQASQARYAAEAGIQWAFWGLLIPPEQTPWIADGSTYQMSLDGIRISAAVEDEYGKIDINIASAEMLQRLLQAADLEAGRAEALADAILDWRDEDDFRRLNGAEDDDYFSAGYSYGAKNAPFDSIDELQRVLGFDKVIFREIRPGITIYSGRQLVNPLVAPKVVLLAFTEQGEGAIDQYIEARRQLHLSGLQPPIEQLSSVYFSTSLKAVNYTIHTQAVIDPRTQSGIAAVVRRQGKQGQRVFKILNVQHEQSYKFSNNEP
ncbi:general secretion pathway protein GspK [Amphritea balenae]|uniref:Type II secretion system protein K n=1 Tax=Amphritea balenae TaxID=452629 RepID=A0A3P1SII0_9GAMM|nr:type II secretion system protein GspK [Amphritea balenae]RRC96790.1 general secretion pathway protein GspK [Amphritea balenae]GGK84860.1 hypothetical protein GCM10007941_39240 [Amphritea balenae]